MSEMERRLRSLSTRLSQWWNSTSRTAKQRSGDGGLRREAEAGNRRR